MSGARAWKRGVASAPYAENRLLSIIVMMSTFPFFPLALAATLPTLAHAFHNPIASFSNYHIHPATRTSSQLSSNGGMDAFDAQMAAVTATADNGGGNGHTNQQQQHSRTASQTHSYAREHPPLPSNFISGAMPSTRQAKIIDDEMQFTNMLLEIQREMENAEYHYGDASNNNESSDMGALPAEVEKAMSQYRYQQPQSSTSPTEAASAYTNPTDSDNEADQPQLDQDDLEDKYLRMLSSEVSYKKLLNQSPYAITDVDWPVLMQRFLDNLEDGAQKNNGKFKGQSRLSRREVPKEERKTVVVLGVSSFA